MLERPPEWLVDLVPWLGHRKARQAWGELFTNSISLSVLFATSFGKWIESTVVIVAVGDGGRWPLWWTWLALAVATFVAIVFGWHFHQAAEKIAEKGTQAAEDAADSVSEAVDSAVDES